MSGFDTSSPGDTSIVSAFPANERAMRTFLSAAFSTDHDSTPGATQGRHNAVTLVERTAPTPVSGYGRLYCKNVSSKTWLMFMDDLGTEIPLAALSGVVGSPLLLPAQVGAPTAQGATTGIWYTKLVSNVPCLFYYEPVNDVEIQFTTSTGEQNIDISETNLQPDTITALSTVFSPRFLNGSMEVEIDAGNVELDLSLASTFYLTGASGNFTVTITGFDPTEASEFSFIVSTTGAAAITSLAMTGVTIYRGDGTSGELGTLPTDGRTVFGCLFNGDTLDVFRRDMVVHA